MINEKDIQNAVLSDDELDGVNGGMGLNDGLRPLVAKKKDVKPPAGATVQKGKGPGVTPDLVYTETKAPTNNTGTGQPKKLEDIILCGGGGAIHT